LSAFDEPVHQCRLVCIKVAVSTDGLEVLYANGIFHKPEFFCKDTKLSAYRNDFDEKFRGIGGGNAIIAAALRLNIGVIRLFRQVTF
jgi:hypothetical protein